MRNAVSIESFSRCRRASSMHEPVDDGRDPSFTYLSSAGSFQRR